MEKNLKIENIRAAAIVLVVLGHSIMLFAGWSWIEATHTIHGVDIIKKAINILEMPLFMSVSGYVYYFSIRKKVKYSAFLLGKAKRILVPFVCVGVFWVVPTRMIAGVKNFRFGFLKNVYLNIFLTKSVGHLCFLLTLFVVFSVMFFVILWVKDSSVGLQLAVLVCLFLISFFTKQEFIFAGIHRKWVIRIFIYLFWFYFGWLLNARKDSFIEQKHMVGLAVKCLSVLAFVVCGYLNYKTKSSICFYVSQIAGVYMFYLWMPSATNGFMRFLSKNSFGLYLFHSPMVWITSKYLYDANPYLILVVNFLLLGAIAAGMTILLRHTPLAFVIGENRVKKSS